MNKSIISLILVILIISMPLTSAEITEKTGESVVVEPQILHADILEKQQQTPVIISLKGLTLGSILLGNEGSQYSPLYSQPAISRIENPRLTQRSPLISSVVHVPPASGTYRLSQDGRTVDLGSLIVYLKKINSEDELFGERIFVSLVKFYL